VAVSVQSVANAFIQLAKDERNVLTNMQVQKLVFLAQGYCLALLDRSLYESSIHAWQFGPVVPKLYNSLQRYGSGNVDSPIEGQDEIATESDEYKIIKAVWHAYGKRSGPWLSSLTHRPGSPWSITWAKTSFGIIPPDEIKQYYKAILGRSEKSEG
jgi:uncharacterized phage-associated protein